MSVRIRSSSGLTWGDGLPVRQGLTAVGPMTWIVGDPHGARAKGTIAKYDFLKGAGVAKGSDGPEYGFAHAEVRWHFSMVQVAFNIGHNLPR